MNIGIKLLVAEDDPNMGTLLKTFLTQKGFTVELAVDGNKAMEAYQQGDIDACILDIMMPYKDGFSVAKDIRRVDKRIPIIFLTAKNLEEDKLKAFGIGADDYVTKPFSTNELLARINATIRRTFDEGHPNKNVYHIGNYVFDYSHETLTCGDVERKLTLKESELLRLFAVNFNMVVERATALEKIWNGNSYFAARSMDVYITKLRKYLKDDPRVLIVNIHGVGFKLTVVTK